MKYLIIFWVAFLLNTHCISQKRKKIDYRTDYDIDHNSSFNFEGIWEKLDETKKDSLKFEMFKRSYSTRYSDHQLGMVVINVKNNLNGNTKEVALNVLSLSAALHYEYNKSFHFAENKYIDSLIMSHSNRFFELSNIPALSEVNFDLYSQNELLKFKNLLNIDSVKLALYTNPMLNRKLRQNNKDWLFEYSNEATLLQLLDKDRTMLAHILFNEGILTYEGIGVLYYFDF